MATKPLIHVIEDDPALNDAYRLILESKDYRVLTSFNGSEALEALKDTKEVPQVILLDLHMPELDGLGFLKAFDASKHPNTTIVVFTNYNKGPDIEAAYELGADRYILKARAAPKELLHLVESIVDES